MSAQNLSRRERRKARHAFNVDAVERCPDCESMPCDCTDKHMREYDFGRLDALTEACEAVEKILEGVAYGDDCRGEIENELWRLREMAELKVASEWNMQKVMATLGYASKEIGQSPDEANAVYYAFCPWAEFERVSAIGHGPHATRAIELRRRTKDKPEAPQVLKDHCEREAKRAAHSFKVQEAARAEHKIQAHGSQNAQTGSFSISLKR